MPDTVATAPGLADRLARRDRFVVLVCVAIVVAAAAAYTVMGIGLPMSAVEMTRMATPVGAPMHMGTAPEWTPAYAALIFFMWWIMMIAMMSPSAAPTLLLFSAVKRTGPDHAAAPLQGLLFLSGYLLAWAGFSAAATAAQWGLESVGQSDGSMMMLRSRGAAAAILLIAGLYQFSDLKRACLDHCRAPAQFLSTHTRPGRIGALTTGAHHGAYCLGCCWALMTLLFVGGIMNLWWIAALALYVGAEKLIGPARWLPKLGGAGLITAAAWLLLAPTA